MATANVIITPKTSSNTRIAKVIQVLICLAALGVLAENVLLVGQNRNLEEAIAPQIVSGAHLEFVGGVSLNGQFQSLPLPHDSKLLIITFSPGCPACQANQVGWMKLAAAAEGRGVCVLWLSRDPVAITRAYCLRKGIPLTDTLADPPYRTYQQLGLARVPNTVLVGATGTVEKVWAGRQTQQSGIRSLQISARSRPSRIFQPKVRRGWQRKDNDDVPTNHAIAFIDGAPGRLYRGECPGVRRTSLWLLHL